MRLKCIYKKYNFSTELINKTNAQMVKNLFSLKRKTSFIVKLPHDL